MGPKPTLRVLVDDDPTTLETFSEAFRHTGFDVEAAPTMPAPSSSSWGTAGGWVPLVIGLMNRRPKSGGRTLGASPTPPSTTASVASPRLKVRVLEDG